jgi:hypothetical protein
MSPSLRSPCLTLPILTLLAALPIQRAPAQLFENLEAFGGRLDVGDPEVATGWESDSREGPKGLAIGDLDGNGAPDLAASNLDGTVTVYWNRGGKLEDPVHLQTGAPTLRGIVIAELTGDGRPDIAVAALVDSKIRVFPGLGGGAFAPPLLLPSWTFARNLAAGDFDGDGAQELVAAGSGVGLRHYRRSDAGPLALASDLPDLDAHGYSKPVYSLKVVRQPGATRDELLVTHAWSSVLWVLAAGATGALEVKGTVSGLKGANWSQGVFSIDAAPIATPAAGGRPDLVTANRDEGVIRVRAAADGPARFSPRVRQEIGVPGMPRAVRIADLDGDGWNDVVVVLRHLNRVLVYRNDRGTLVPSSEMPVGQSPRDLVVGDINLDGHLDIAVANRASSDISILHGHPGQAGFGVLDQFYLVDGEVAGLKVLDWNRDGRDDVIQLHRASGDLSIRLAGPDGTLAPPTFAPMGPMPGAEAIADVNNDGLPDAVAANLGVEKGSITVRLGQPDGSLGPAQEYELPPDVAGRFFALEVADFDLDGNLDLAAGFMDCRLAFFRGTGTGSFTFTREHFFVYEARVMVARDFDGDGDSDLAGAGYAGDLVVVENRGDLLTAPALARRDYPSPSEGKFGTRDLKAVDLNGDGDLDLVLGSGEGAMVYTGLEGTRFILSAETLPGTNFPASSLALADLDGDGQTDIAVSCRVLSCVTILTRAGDGDGFLPALSVDVPAGRLIAAGDLDGDGHADLVGSGDVLWTALSSRRARRSGPPVLVADRPVAPGPVINEVLGINNQWPLAVDGGKTVDWVELYSGAPAPVSLAGWTLRVIAAGSPQGAPPLEYRFPAEARLASGSHLLLIFSNNLRSPFHTGFKLPGDGGTLLLLDAAGSTADQVDYPPQRENLSYARYRDGVASFTFNNFPSPGGPNADNGAVPPALELKSLVSAAPDVGLTGRAPAPGEPIRITAEGDDDVGIVSASLLYQRTDIPDPTAHRVILYDDGMHQDGGMQDGSFAGVLDPGLPEGAEIRFQLEVEDLSDHRTVLPDGGAPGDDDDEGSFYTLAVSRRLPRLELSELVSRNDNGLRDEAGGRPDWVEIRSCAASPVSLQGIYLAKNIGDSTKWLALPPERSLDPGQHLVAFCDGATEQGPLHAPFSLDREGGRVFLVGTSPGGAHGIIDVLEYGPQAPDRAMARQGCGGEWATDVAPTPGAENAAADVARGDVDASGRLDISDPIAILIFLFQGGPIQCLRAADTNGDQALDISDAVYLLAHLFGGGPAPAAGATGCVQR